MKNLKVRIGNELCGEGKRIYAVRNQDPHVVRGNYYTIKALDNPGVCANSLIVLNEVEGVYTPKTFIIKEQN